MSSTLNDQSLLCLPKPKLKSKYKSPQCSPSSPKPKSHHSHKPSDSFKENLVQNLFYSKDSKKPGKKHLSAIENTNNNILELQNFIQKYHPALSQKSENSNKQQIEKSIKKHKQLKELLSVKEKELSQKVLESSNKITKNIQKTQNEIDTLESYLETLKKTQKTEDFEYRELKSENLSITESISNIKALIANYKQSGIKKSQFSVVTTKIIELESIQESLLSTNSSLKKELHNQVSLNSASKACSDLATNKRSLDTIYFQIAKLEKIAKKYLANERINLIEIFHSDEKLPEETLPVYIGIIKKQICSLRMLVSDIYAENCGDSCQTQ